jgi:glutaminyl-tRNA synthetase
MDNSEKKSTNFIHEVIEKDIEAGKYQKRVHTRFPPEPNGYLHIGHAKAITIDFATADKYKGLYNLRFDDTNPVKEDTEYVDSIMEDIKWLGFDWQDRLFYASDYFEKMYNYAVELIEKGLAYVDDLTADEMRAYRGTLTEPGKNSPYRDRSVEENKKLFAEMREGKHEDGSKIVRAKIDMASPNLTMRDPAIYRIAHFNHHRTGDTWCIYPMYDFAHPLEDAIEGITHSLCTLEFESHRPLYNWVLANLNDFQVDAPKQIEFARLEITRTVMSKRKLKLLVDEGIVSGWDDPRMPTLSGMRRRGFTPESIKNFCEMVGVSKSNSTVDSAMLEHAIRDDLKLKAPRLMAVMNPLKVVITNWPKGQVEMLEVDLNQEVPEMGKRLIPFSGQVFVDRDDFMEEPVKKFYRLFPGNEVRLRGAYFVKCNEVIKDETGQVIELRCTYDPETKSGSGFTGRKVRGTLHWVPAKESVKTQVRLYDYLLLDEEEQTSKDFLENINPNSMETIDVWIEPELAKAKSLEKFQFIRHGYFSVDPKDSTDELPVFNRVVSLKSSWKKKKK